MNFFATKVEITPTTWEVHSKTEHSAVTVEFLGLNEEGWITLQFNPRVANSDIMAQALLSACVNMANPDKDSCVIGKMSGYGKIDDSNSVIVEAEDLTSFFNELTCCNCITKEDAELISKEIRELSKIPVDNTSVSTAPISVLRDENHSSDQQHSFVH